MDNRTKIPVLPLKDIVIFPTMAAPLFLAGEISIISIENALLTKDHEIILLAYKNASIEKYDEENLYETGILGKIIQIVKFPDGSVKALIEGIHRVKAFEFTKKEKLIQCKYKFLHDKKQKKAEDNALMKFTAAKFSEYIQKVTKMKAESFISLSEIKDAGKIADIIATYISADIAEKQKVIEELDVYKRLEYVNKLLSKELELVNIEESLQEKVKSSLGKTQKEYLLREKLKAIKEELGSKEGMDESEELRSRIENTKIPQKVSEKLLKEAGKLERMSFLTAETSVIRTYIETVLELPWCKKTKDVLDIHEARKILDEDHHGLEDAKERILEFLAVKKLSKEPQATIICFAGPPGVGKTSLARSIARALNRNFTQVSLGGINDESEIRGHRRTYVGAMPGRIIRAFQDAGTKNPVILLDEIEKMLPSHMGDPTAAMLEVLDPAQNSHYTDHYIDMEFDLSDAFFLATANTVDRLYKPLKDRLEIIYLSGYTEEEKISIAEKFLIPRQLKVNGISKAIFEIRQSGLKSIIESYTREAGVRELERNIAKICRKFAVELVSEKKQKICIDSENLKKYLGVVKFEREEAEKEPLIGLVHGLAWTEFGGEILEIEAGIMPGRGNLNLTGRLGEVMQESAKTAFSYARSRYKELNLPPDIQEKYDVHIHAADGATPKDGPSAGTALAISLISALTKRPVRADTAMTGEITLRGRVLPIGGLKEKSIAALRNGIKIIIIPKGNEKDIQEFPDYIKNKIDYKPIKNLDEIIDFMLSEKISEPKALHNGKKKNGVVLPKYVK